VVATTSLPRNRGRADDFGGDWHQGPVVIMECILRRSASARFLLTWGWEVLLHNNCTLVAMKLFANRIVS
jgi:hypothetical protein